MSRWDAEISARLRPAGLEPARELEIVRELGQHLDDRYGELIASGAPPSAAAEQALAELDDHGLMTHDLARIERLEGSVTALGQPRRGSLVAGVWQDVRYGARTLRASSGFTLLAIVTLALGIGATTAVFSVVDSMLLRPLRADPDGRIVRVFMSSVRPSETRTRLYTPSLTSMREWQHRRDVFEAIGVWAATQLTLLDVDPVDRVPAMAVSPDVFRLFDRRPAALGRLFSEADGDQPLAVISHAAWQRRFGGAADVIGRSIRAAEGTRTIVGVLPPDFPYEPAVEFWVPFAATPRHSSSGWGGRMLARLAPGVSVAQAQLAFAAETHGTDRYRGTPIEERVSIVSLHESSVDFNRRMLYSLLGAVGCLLLIACVNVAGLLVARGSTRGREVAIRASLGARRSRLIRQFLTESVLLAALGGAAGIVLAWLLLETLVGILPINVPAEMRPALDVRLLAYAALITLATGIAHGLLPAIRLSRTDLSSATKAAPINGSGSSANRTGRVLVAIEVALALVLLVGAGLMVRSVQRLLAIDSGFDAERVVVALASPVLPAADAANRKERVDAFYQAVVDRVSAIPGVSAVGAIDTLPFWAYGAAMATVDAPTPATLQVSPREVLPGYFAAMGIPFKAGRDFTNTDRPGGPCVAIVNEFLVTRTGLGESAVGRRIKARTDRDEWCAIVGVVANVRHRSLEDESFAELYFSSRQTTSARELAVVVRSQHPQALPAAIRAQLVDLPERTLVSRIAPFEAFLDRSTSTRRNRAVLLSLVGGLGLLLACVGIFGLTAYAVTRRTREIGVRMALGATPAGVIRAVIGSFLPAIGAGLVAGLLGAWAATRVVEQFLFGVERHDLLTLATVTVLLAALAVLACYLPARRAMRVDPVVALRTE
jgi:putative ABC transport system permease protein